MTNLQISSVRCISLWQPWASLWVMGDKLNETRSWRTYPGWTGVHASKRAMDARDSWQYNTFLLEHSLVDWGDKPLGALLGFVYIEECVPVENLTLTAQEKALGNYSPGRFAWVTRPEKRIILPEPIPMRGQQGFWSVSVPQGVCLNG